MSIGSISTITTASTGTTRPAPPRESAATTTGSDGVALPDGSPSFRLGGTLSLVDPALTVELRTFNDADLAETMAYHEANAAYMMQVSDFVKNALGLPANSGLSLSGGMIDIAKKAAAEAGILPPDKPDGIRAQEQANGDGEDGMSEAVKGTSMLGVYYSQEDGGGSVEIWLDNDKIEQLLSHPDLASPDGLIDMNADTDEARAVTQSMADGLFGAFMREHRDTRPEWGQDMASRRALTDPADGATGSPILMIQSQTRSDPTGDQSAALMAGLVGLLRAGT